MSISCIENYSLLVIHYKYEKAIDVHAVIFYLPAYLLI